MSDHGLAAGPYPAKLDGRGFPLTRRNGRSRRVFCDACGVGGYPECPWLDAHRSHVTCSCGKVVSEVGFVRHCSTLNKKGAPVPEPPEVAEIRAVLRKQKGAWAFDRALLEETKPGGALWNDHGYTNPAVILTFIEIIGRCPGHARVAVERLRESVE